jgi:chemotaxis protein MotB
MSRKKKHPEHVNHERWLVSFADFMTLLFAFFVVMYASSQVDKRKVGQLAVAIQTAFQQLGVFQSTSGTVPINASLSPPPDDNQAVPGMDTATLGRVAPPLSADALSHASAADVQKMMRELQKLLVVEIKKQEISVRATPDGVVLSLQEIGFYDPGSDVLRPGAEAILDRLVPVLTGSGNRLRIEGHTDNVPIHNARFPSNWELSTARATGLVRLFVDKYSIVPQRLSAAGFAEYHPVAENTTPAGRGLNRRVDIVIQPPDKYSAEVMASAPPRSTPVPLTGRPTALPAMATKPPPL